MSPWAPDTKSVLDHPVAPLPESGAPDPVHGSVSKKLSGWRKVVPFFTSAIFFMSGVFTIFAPLPLLFMNLKWGRTWAIFAVAVSAVLVSLVGGAPSVAIYLALVGSVALLIPELLRRGVSIETATVLGLLGVLAAGAGGVTYFAYLHHVAPWTEAQNQVSILVDLILRAMPPEALDPSAGIELEEWKTRLTTEIPSAIGIMALLMVWANLVLVMRANPNGIRERMGMDASSLRRWKAPEFLIWPTIASGFLLVVDLGLASDVALNSFRFLMAIYALQGLSVLSYFFENWGLKGFFRGLAYTAAVFLMMPLLLSLGFFDLWFDFRSKFRQS
jgi:hypothetical protein